ncbi:MAG TPA: hypothetical protein VEZ48_10825 [Sphingomonadaceae bacterium]|nr:hypothetical protein [Sphingomonadaceae bacterium]
MSRAALLFLSAMLALTGGCAPGSGGGATEETAGASTAATRPDGSARVLRSETMTAVFTGWDVGDYVWARLRIEGRDEFGAWSGPSPIDLFLDAHVGKPIAVTIDTTFTDVPEAGGEIEVPRITAARIGDLTADAWWASLSPRQRQDARIGLAGALEPRPPSQ